MRLLYEMNGNPEGGIFSPEDKEVLNQIKNELQNLNSFIQIEALPKLRDLGKVKKLENPKLSGRFARPAQDALSSVWTGVRPHFPAISQEMTGKLKAITLDDKSLFAPNIAELINNLSQTPHVARVYGQDTIAMFTDISHAITKLSKIIG